MTRTNERHRSLLLAGLIVMAAAVGAVGAVGTVGAQDAGNETGENASEEEFYSPPADDPLNVRFRDCCANTVDSTDGGVLNLNIVYGPAEESYDIEISAANLSEEQVNAITYGNDTELSPTDLERSNIVGMNFTGVPAGEYDFTVTVVGEDATTTVPLEITGEAAANAASDQSATDETTSAEDTATANDTSATNTSTSTSTSEAEAANATTNGTTSATTADETEMGAGNGTAMGNGTMANGTTTATPTANGTTADTTTTETGNETEMGAGNGTMANETMGNETMMNTTGNVSVVAEPSAANATANHTVSVVVPAEAEGNLTNMTVNYGEANVSFGLVLNSIQSASLGDTNLTGANVTSSTYGPSSQNLTIGFESGFTASQGDRLTVAYGGVTNPAEMGNYTVGVAVNNGSFVNTTLSITEANESMMTTTGSETTGTNETTGTAGTTEAEMGATADETRTTQNGATTADNADTTANDGNTTADGGETATNGTNGSGGTETTAAGGPGFTLVAGVVALLAAALVAARRD